MSEKPRAPRLREQYKDNGMEVKKNAGAKGLLKKQNMLSRNARIIEQEMSEAEEYEEDKRDKE